jgi:cytochrome c-type biogenesis protein CcmH/NrfF
VLLDLKTLGYEAKYLKAGPPELQRVRWLLVWGAPGTFLVAGLVVLWLRRRS